MAKTGRLIYAASETCADLLYATKVFVPDPFPWCEVAGRRLVVINPLEYGRLRAHAPRDTEVLSHAEARRRFGLRDLRPASIIAGISRASGVRRWIVPPAFPCALAEQLARRKLSVRVAKGPFFPERELKTAAEAALLAEGVAMAEAGLRAGLAVLRAAVIVGDRLRWQDTELTAELLRAEINVAITRAGGSAPHTIVAPGRHGADPHDEGAGPIRPHEPIVMDIFPRVGHSGYWGDLTRTVVKGQAPDVVRRAHAAVRRARDAGIGMVRDGVAAGAVHDHVSAVLREAGFATDLQADPPHGFIHGTGHGVGLEIHEAPRISKASGVLKAGHVVTVEPGVYYPEWGGMRLEDVVVVTPEGCRNLTTADDTLEIP